VNAVFGRLLKAPGGHIVTLATGSSGKMSRMMKSRILRGGEGP